MTAVACPLVNILGGSDTAHPGAAVLPARAAGKSYTPAPNLAPGSNAGGSFGLEHKRHCAPWTSRERARFRYLWTQTVVPRAQIAAEMGRTKTACSAQAQYMVIKRPALPAKERKRKEPARISNAGRATAERQAETIRAYWVSIGHPRTVDVVYVSLGKDKGGAWSAVVAEPVAFVAPAVPGLRRRG